MADYGNVPEDDVVVVQYGVRLALRIASKLPEVVPQEWKPIAYEMVLDAILRDWVAEGAAEPDEADEGDLGDLMRLACDTALVQESALREITFRTVLRNVMNDWVENWQAGDEEGV